MDSGKLCHLTKPSCWNTLLLYHLLLTTVTTTMTLTTNEDPQRLTDNVESSFSIVPIDSHTPTRVPYVNMDSNWRQMTDAAPIYIFGSTSVDVDKMPLSTHKIPVSEISLTEMTSEVKHTDTLMTSLPAWSYRQVNRVNIVQTTIHDHKLQQSAFTSAGRDWDIVTVELSSGMDTPYKSEPSSVLSLSSEVPFSLTTLLLRDSLKNELVTHVKPISTYFQFSEDINKIEMLTLPTSFLQEHSMCADCLVAGTYSNSDLHSEQTKLVNVETSINAWSPHHVSLESQSHDVLLQRGSENMHSPQLVVTDKGTESIMRESDVILKMDNFTHSSLAPGTDKSTLNTESFYLEAWLTSSVGEAQVSRASVSVLDESHATAPGVDNVIESLKSVISTLISGSMKVQLQVTSSTINYAHISYTVESTQLSLDTISSVLQQVSETFHGAVTSIPAIYSFDVMYESRYRASVYLLKSEDEYGVSHAFTQSENLLPSNENQHIFHTPQTLNTLTTTHNVFTFSTPRSYDLQSNRLSAVKLSQATYSSASESTSRLSAPSREVTLSSILHHSRRIVDSPTSVSLAVQTSVSSNLPESNYQFGTVKHLPTAATSKTNTQSESMRRDVTSLVSLSLSSLNMQSMERETSLPLLSLAPSVTSFLDSTLQKSWNTNTITILPSDAQSSQMLKIDITLTGMSLNQVSSLLLPDIALTGMSPNQLSLLLLPAEDQTQSRHALFETAVHVSPTIEPSTYLTPEIVNIGWSSGGSFFSQSSLMDINILDSQIISKTNLVSTFKDSNAESPVLPYISSVTSRPTISGAESVLDLTVSTSPELQVKFSESQAQASNYLSRSSFAVPSLMLSLFRESMNPVSSSMPSILIRSSALLHQEKSLSLTCQAASSDIGLLSINTERLISVAILSPAVTDELSLTFRELSTPSENILSQIVTSSVLETVEQLSLVPLTYTSATPSATVFPITTPAVKNERNDTGNWIITNRLPNMDHAAEQLFQRSMSSQAYLRSECYQCFLNDTTLIHSSNNPVKAIFYKPLAVDFDRDFRIRLEVNILSDQFRLSLEKRLADCYVMAKTRSEEITNGTYVPLYQKRRRFASADGDESTKVDIVYIKRFGDTPSVDVVYVVEKDGQPLHGALAAEQLNLLSEQEMAIHTGYVISSVAKPYITEDSHSGYSLKWIIIGCVLAGAVIIVIVVITVWLCRCSSCCSKATATYKVKVEIFKMSCSVKKTVETKDSSNQHPPLVGNEKRSQPEMFDNSIVEAKKENSTSKKKVQKKLNSFNFCRKSKSVEVVNLNSPPDDCDQTGCMDINEHAIDGLPDEVISSALKPEADTGKLGKEKSPVQEDKHSATKAPRRRMGRPQVVVKSQNAEHESVESELGEGRMNTPKHKKNRKKNLNTEENVQLVYVYKNQLASLNTVSPETYTSGVATLYSQPTIEEENNLIENAEEERKKNKQRMRTKKMNENMHLSPAKITNKLEIAYQNAQREIDAVLVPQSKDTDMERDTLHKDETNKKKDVVEINIKHLKDEANSDDEKSLEKTRQKMHKLLDDAFSVISQSTCSINKMEPSRQSSQESSNSQRNVTRTEQAIQTDLSMNKEKLHTPVQVHHSLNFHDQTSLITWSPYRAYDDATLISLSQAEENLNNTPIHQENITTTIFEQPFSSHFKYYATEPGEPIVIKTKNLKLNLLQDGNKSELSTRKNCQSPSCHETPPLNVTSRNQETLQKCVYLSTLPRQEAQTEDTVRSVSIHDYTNSDIVDIIKKSIQPGVSPQPLINSLRNELQTLSCKRLAECSPLENTIQNKSKETIICKPININLLDN